ncbi:hypothetical protein [Nocardia sp. NPDC051832]|uniref:hypothetical protein n=1 Tax=Nocardia sp. NPDC051832 TaxID=3155673 RepID=UPI0034154982
MAAERSSTSRQQRRAAQKATPGTDAFMLIGTPVALAILSYPMWPADLGNRLTDAAVAALFGAAVVIAAILATLAMLAFIRGRGLRWLRLRRRWQRAVIDAGLGVERPGEVRLPELISVNSGHAAEVARIRMLDGQTPANFAAALHGLARSLGVQTAHLRLVANRPTQIDLLLTRTRRWPRAEKLATVTVLGRGGAA